MSWLEDLIQSFEQAEQDEGVPEPGENDIAEGPSHGVYPGAYSKRTSFGPLAYESMRDLRGRNDRSLLPPPSPPHDPLGEDWEKEFEKANGTRPKDQDRRDRLFSLLFPGQGDYGQWTPQDWDQYYRNRDKYWKGEEPWPGAPPQGVQRFEDHLSRLASFYGPGEKDQFVQAVGFIWAGIPPGPAWNALEVGLDANRADVRYPFLREGTKDWNAALKDDYAVGTRPPDDNPSHHYAAFFYAGYFFGALPAQWMNYLRDLDNPEDIALGTIAASHGEWLRKGIISPKEVSTVATYALDARPALWPADSPQFRAQQWWRWLR